MPKKILDSAPRNYAPFVLLLRRSQGDPTVVPRGQTFADIEAWLMREALGEDDLLVLFEQFVWRLVGAGLPLDRASVHVGTLHPEILGFAWNWNAADGLCDEVKVEQASNDSDSYRKNPLFQVLEFGRTVHEKLEGPSDENRAPLLIELAGQGITEYCAMPLHAGGGYHNAATIATRQPGGFTEEQFTALDRFLKLLAMHVQRHIAVRISANLVNTYLGSAAGVQVLKGSISRGTGAPIRAIIWVSDLRGFTDLSDRLDGPEMIALLNAYFEQLAGAVIDHDGEVLKFIGDGLLAVFPYASFETPQAAASAALAAAQAAEGAVSALNTDPASLPGIEGWRPLRTGIGLHEGEVFFGNVGAPARLDFTVIGRAVNATSRVEELTKSLGRSILLTQPVADLLAVPLDHLGKQPLRGLSEPVGIYSPQRPS